MKRLPNSVVASDKIELAVRIKRGEEECGF